MAGKGKRDGWVEFPGAGRDFDEARYARAFKAIGDAWAFSLQEPDVENSATPEHRLVLAALRERLVAFGVVPPKGFETYSDAVAWLMTAFEKVCEGLTHLERATLTQTLYLKRVSLADRWLPDEDAKTALMSDIRALLCVAHVRPESLTRLMMSLSVTLDRHPDAAMDHDVEQVVRYWCQSLLVHELVIDDWRSERADGHDPLVERVQVILKGGLGSLVVNPQRDRDAGE